jgi:predicted ArsR family transcriptional regulator
MLLCRRQRTVGELAGALRLTSNAVRAQLQRLLRDGLAQQAGSRPGVRRPHADYHVTSKGRRLFPTGYEAVLNALLDVLAKRLPQRTISKLLVEMFCDLADRRIGKLNGQQEPRGRLAQFLDRVAYAAPGIELQEKAGRAVIQTCSCPLASVTTSHPQLCRIVASALTRLLRTTVSEHCSRDEWPQCSFNIELGTRVRGR